MAKQIILSQIKTQLENGISRKEITAELQLNPREAKTLWNQPSLKGIKVAKYKDDLVFVNEVVIKEDVAQTTIPFHTSGTL